MRSRSTILFPTARSATKKRFDLDREEEEEEEGRGGETNVAENRNSTCEKWPRSKNSRFSFEGDGLSILARSQVPCPFS